MSELSTEPILAYIDVLGPAYTFVLNLGIACNAVEFAIVGIVTEVLTTVTSIYVHNQFFLPVEILYSIL